MWPTVTIAAVKAAVQEKEGTPTEKQWLVLDGELLNDDRTLADYFMSHGTTLKLYSALPPAPLLQLYVHSSIGCTTLNVYSCATTVKDVKCVIKRRGGILCEEQRLIFAGRELEDRVIVMSEMTPISILIHHYMTVNQTLAKLLKCNDKRHKLNHNCSSR